MLLPSRKPSSSYSLLKFVYVTSQLRHSLVVHPLLRKILDPPLQEKEVKNLCPLPGAKQEVEMIARLPPGSHLLIGEQATRQAV